MLLGDIYQTAIRLGMEADPRGKETVETLLRRKQQDYQELKEKDRKYFDQEQLTNPYSDTRILAGEPGLEVEGILAGIDMETAEVLLADRLRQNGRRIDLVLTHHPEGKALANLYDVMHLQEDVLYDLGVPINVAEGIMEPRISEVQRGLMPLNHNRTIDAARLLGFALLSVHTPADNLVNRHVEEALARKKPLTVGEVVEALLEIEEYAKAAEGGAGPKVVLGDKKRRAGKVWVDMTGGTSGSEEAYAKLAMAGVGTVICMHISDKHRKEAEKSHVNVVIAGHMASDSLGMNLFLDELERRSIQLHACSGLLRVKRLDG